MRYYLTLGFFSLALATPVRAQVVIQNRFVNIRVGGGQGTYVQVGNPAAPIVTVNAPAAPRPMPTLEGPDGVPLQIGPPAKPVPLPDRDTPAPPQPKDELPRPKPDGGTIRAMTPHEFACTFKPECGSYEVVLIHPCTGCPVRVCFTLRPCCRGVIDHGNRLEFDYGCFLKDTVIRFNRNGGVHVRN